MSTGIQIVGAGNTTTMDENLPPMIYLGKETKGHVEVYKAQYSEEPFSQIFEYQFNLYDACGLVIDDLVSPTLKNVPLPYIRDTYSNISVNKSLCLLPFIKFEGCLTSFERPYNSNWAVARVGIGVEHEDYYGPEHATIYWFVTTHD